MSNGNKLLAQTAVTAPSLCGCCGGWPLVRRLLIVVAVCLLTSAGKAQTLSAHVAVSASSTNFTYTIFNDQPQGSTLSLSSFYLELDAPIQSILSPPGWKYYTDGVSYVAWMCANGTPPFTNDIPPGASLGGFVVRSPVLTTNSFNCDIVSSDTAATKAGPVFSGSIAAPAITSLAPRLALSQSNSLFELSVVGVPYYLYSIQTSTNLTNWVTMTTNASPFIFSTAATNSAPAMFYQAVLQTTQD